MNQITFEVHSTHPIHDEAGNVIGRADYLPTYPEEDFRWMGHLLASGWVKTSAQGPSLEHVRAQILEVMKNEDYKL